MPIDPNVAGIDLGSAIHYVAAPDGPDHAIVKEYECFTPDLVKMAEWLKERGVYAVVMESTGAYWVPVFQVLEDSGLKVMLVDARYQKNLPGRKKTDVHDCAWLRKLQAYGLLRACFVPEKNIEHMRTYWRYRAKLVNESSQQILRMQKAYEQMNIQIHKVLSDISGVTGMRITRAILAGERDPLVLARYRQPNVKSSEEMLVKALTGNWREDHLFMLKLAVDSYDFIHRQIAECDGELQKCLAALTPKDRGPSDDASSIVDENPDGMMSHSTRSAPIAIVVTRADPIPEIVVEADAATTKKQAKGENRAQRRKRVRLSKNAPRSFNLRDELKRILGVDLTKIDGLDVMTILTVISECGPTLSAFPTAKQWASYLGLCPNNRVTGGKIKSSSTNKNRHRAAQALRQAAESLHHSDSAMGAFYRRLTARIGAPKAITAVAHKLACLIWRMIKFGEEYVDQGQKSYEEQYQRSQRDHLIKRARNLGLLVVVPGTGEVVS